MGRVLTNNVNLAYNLETSQGVLGPDWKNLEPNEINTFGAEITTVARDPISRNRQRRKGVVTDLDSSVEFVTDLTISAFRDFIRATAFVEGINTNVTQIVTTASAATGNEYTVPALDADQAARLQAGALLWVTGFPTNSNNYLKTVATTPAALDTVIAVNETLTDETPIDGRLSLGGYRIPSATGATTTWDAVNRQLTLTSTGITAIAQASGLTVGQRIHIGSVATLGGAIQNAFDSNAAFGYARVISFPDADSILLDKVDVALQQSDTDPGTDVDLCWGEFVRNVPVGDPEYVEQFITFEGTFPNLGDGTPANTDEAYQYAVENLVNTIAVEMPLTDKATMTCNFIGTDTRNPTTTRETGAANAANPVQVAAFNTSSDFARLRIEEVDDDGLTTDFKSVTLTFNNNVSPEKVLGTLGARFMNTGNFLVDVESVALFSNPLVINAIRDNETLTMDFILKNDDGVISIDLPSITLGDGSREFPRDESVTVNVTSASFGDTEFNTSTGVSLFAVPLP